MHEMIIGGIVGLTQNIIGHPFDTLKVLVQNGAHINKTNFMPRHLYAGVAYPMAHLVLTNALVFDNYKTIKEKYNISNFNAAFASGILSSPITYLFECGKVQRQTDGFITSKSITNNVNKVSTSMFSYFRKGFLMTMAREGFGMGFYFSTYFYCRNDIHWNPLIAGSAAGVMSWTTTYQFDVLKNRQMAHNITLKEAIKMGDFWKGYKYCILRAILVNGVSLLVYDKLTSL